MPYTTVICSTSLCKNEAPHNGAAPHNVPAAYHLKNWSASLPVLLPTTHPTLQLANPPTRLLNL